MRKEVKVLLGATLLALGSAHHYWLGPLRQRASGPLEHEAYVWQRRWTGEVREAVSAADPALERLVVLCAEVEFRGGRPRVARVPLDTRALLASRKAVGLALRVGPYPGPFDREGELTRFLVDLASKIVREAQDGGIAPAELQIDFDCATSKLGGYQVWVEQIQGTLDPLPVTITVLPTWMGSSAFSDLVAAASGFVLQVHSIERPAGPDAPLSLCDPAASVRWVKRAASYGRPFRVALPTYGYIVGFGADKKCLGLCAEGSLPDWPEGTILREVRAEPEALSALVRRWKEERPELLRGIIWYRLPVKTDVLNWRWTTLAAVMDGRTPQSSLKAEAREVEPCLFEVILRNDGELDLPLRDAVSVRWPGARLVAGDVFEGVEWIDGESGKVTLRQAAVEPPRRILPGEDLTLAWLRLSEEVKIDVELVPSNS